MLICMIAAAYLSKDRKHLKEQREKHNMNRASKNRARGRKQKVKEEQGSDTIVELNYMPGTEENH